MFTDQIFLKISSHRYITYIFYSHFEHIFDYRKPFTPFKIY